MMRRMMVLVTVALVMAAMMAVFSTGAVAEPPSNANACSEAAAAPLVHQTGGQQFGGITSSLAQSGGQEFGEFIAGISTGCSQG